MGTAIVCKHAHAALSSVLDMELERNEAKRAPKTTGDRYAGFATLDLALPGERTRLEHGLTSSTAEEVLAMIRTRLGTVDGLRAAAQLFPPSLMPTKIVRYCQRCEKEWDPQFPAQSRCRIEHPYDCVSTQWEGSKVSYSHCSECGEDFNGEGTSNVRRLRGIPSIHEKSWCFEGAHIAEREEGEGDSEEGDLSEEET
jgi:hypothetical protein